MALTVEDGTGLVNADAYISVADADTYFLASANATWAAATSPAKMMSQLIIDQNPNFAYTSCRTSSRE